MPTLTSEPTSFRAGDSVAWSKSLASYPASTWTLKYRLINADSAQAEVTATADGDDFDIEITPAVSAAYPAGSYRLVGWVTDGTDRHTVYEGDCEVLADLVAATDGVDSRTHAQKAIDKIEAAIEKYATDPIETLTLANRSYTITRLADLFALKKKYEYERKCEVDRERIAMGQKAKRILFTFGSPS